MFVPATMSITGSIPLTLLLKSVILLAVKLIVDKLMRLKFNKHVK